MSNPLQTVRNMSALGIALTVSVLVHAVLLTVRFVDPERFNRVFQDTPLEVILVNAKSIDQPDKAQAIAQATLAGGGEADKGRATTPLPVSALTEVGDSYEEQKKQVDSLHEQQMQLLLEKKKEIQSQLEVTQQTNANSELAKAQEEKLRQTMRLLAEIEKRIQEENARPKKRFISPATREAAYALYYDQLRRKIEDKGTQNFPEAAGNKLYGQLIISITINFTGEVLETRVEQTSGNATLDRRAEAIAKSAAPFGKFTDDMKTKAEQIVVVSLFKFGQNNTLETKLTTPR